MYRVARCIGRRSTGGRAGKIQRSNLDGSNVEDLVTRGLRSPDRIALDVAGGQDVLDAYTVEFSHANAYER